MFRAHSLSYLILPFYLLFNDPLLALPYLSFVFFPTFPYPCLPSSCLSSSSLTFPSLPFTCLTNCIQWPLLILDHDDNEHEIQMSPGDMVLYESAKLLHGRPSTYTVQISPLSILCLLASLLHSIIHSSNSFTRCVIPLSYSPHLST